MLFVQDAKGYRQVTAAELISMMKAAHSEITRATDYAGYLMQGTSCDSSADSKFRMAYVEKAETAFVEEHKKEILAAAAELVLRDIHALEDK